MFYVISTKNIDYRYFELAPLCIGLSQPNTSLQVSEEMEEGFDGRLKWARFLQKEIKGSDKWSLKDQVISGNIVDTILEQ